MMKNRHFTIYKIDGYIQTIYLLVENDLYVLLDGCTKADIETVEKFMHERFRKRLEDIDLVIATHAHADHSGGLSIFKKRGIKIAGPVGLNNWYKGLFGSITYLVDTSLAYLVAINKKRKFKNIFFKKYVELDIELKEGDHIPGIHSWSILETPGHTNVDITLYRKDSDLAYVADNIISSKRNSFFAPYPLFLPKEYKKTLKRYKDLNIKKFLLAHYGEHEIEQKDLNKILSSVSDAPKRHLNSLHLVGAKLLRSTFAKKKKKVL